MTIWFTADTHFGHKNICELAQRPFRSAEEHDAVLISNWNELVQPQDTVYHLGDFALAKRDYMLEVRRKLHGDICILLGNHDSEIEKPAVRDQFHFVKDLYFFKQKVEGREDKVRIHLCHYPMVHWCESHHGTWHLHGHCHGELPDDPTLLRIDIGVDCNGFQPVRLENVIAIMENRILKGAGPQRRHAPKCVRCGSPLDAGRCTDSTCPFSDCAQDDQRGWVGHPDKP
jgi:calcineurin-like phosphoesterase family protein